jgi:cellulose synthase/poly-beta-1,6-N-acetylglucosamine synthase-like glycosyltransferase
VGEGGFIAALSEIFPRVFGVFRALGQVQTIGTLSLSLFLSLSVYQVVPLLYYKVWHVFINMDFVAGKK